MRLALMVAVLSMAFAAAAQGRAPMPGLVPQGSIDMAVRAAMNPKIAEQIGITEEQAAKLKALQSEKGNNKELNEKVRKGMARQKELLNAEKIDEAAVMATVDEIWEARKEMAKGQLKRVIAVRSILTADQVKKATEAVKAMRGMRRAQNGEAKPKLRGKGPKAAPKAE